MLLLDPQVIVGYGRDDQVGEYWIIRNSWQVSWLWVQPAAEHAWEPLEGTWVQACASAMHDYLSFVDNGRACTASQQGRAVGPGRLCQGGHGEQPQGPLWPLPVWGVGTSTDRKAAHHLAARTGIAAPGPATIVSNLSSPTSSPPRPDAPPRCAACKKSTTCKRGWGWGWAEDPS